MKPGVLRRAALGEGRATRAPKRKSINSPRILVIAAMGTPPYTGGVETVVETFLKSGLSGEFDQSVHDIYNPPKASRGLLARLTNAVRLAVGTALSILRSRPAIVHIHSAAGISFIRASLCLLVSRALGRRTVFHLHGGGFDDEYASAGRLRRVWTRWTIRRAHHVIALSSYWQEFLSGITEPERIAILNNPIDCRALEPRSELKRGADVVLIGSLGKRKGHFDVLDTVPKVLEKLPECRFLFAGIDEYVGARAELEALVEERGLGEHVEFLGPVTGADKVELLHQSGALILPSHGENMPLTVLEGMAAEVPVIASDVGAVPEAIEHGRHGLLMKAGDTNTLADHIVSTLSDREESKKRARRARRKAVESWDVPAITRQLADLYRAWLKK